MPNKIIKEDLDFIINHDLNWNEFSDKNILITGANGFLPAYMAETLLYLNEIKILNKPCNIFALTRNIKHSQARFSNCLSNNNFKLINHDVSEIFHIKEKIDFIIHAASPASPKYFGSDPIGVILPNVIGTINMLNIAKEKEASFLYFSSGEVYGKIPVDTEAYEDTYGYLDPLDLRSCYGESKRMGENLCVCYGFQHNVSTKIVRIYHTYGPGMKLDDGRVFADFTKNIIENKNIELKSDGAVMRSFCYVADAVAGFFTVMLKGKNNEAYNISNPSQTVSIKKLANILINLFPEKKLKVVFKERQENNYLETKIKGSLPNINKIMNIGWHPIINIEDGFYRTIMSYYI